MKLAIAGSVLLLAGAAIAWRNASPYTLSSRYLTMRDGVRIAIDVYVPASRQPNERVPTILDQTRYYRANVVRWWARPFYHDLHESAINHFSKRGYAFVIVDARGSGASFGTRTQEFSPDEIRDGDEVANWIVAQPWSNGKIGTRGGSYEGVAANLALKNRNPAIRAVIPYMAFYDAYRDAAFPGGVRMGRFLDMWAKATYALDHDCMRDSILSGIAKAAFIGAKPVDEDRDGSLLAAAAREHIGNYNLGPGARGHHFRDETDQVEMMSAYPHGADFQASGAAILNYDGWYDGAFLIGSIKRFLNVRTPGSRLVIGPWNHQGQDINPFSKAADDFSHLSVQSPFLDRFLKDSVNGSEHDPPVRYFTVGEDRWKSSDVWPPAATPTTYYPSAGNGLAQRPDSGADVYHVDYTAGSGPQSRFRSLLYLDMTGIPLPDRRERDKKLLTYTTAPLTSDVEVTGHPSIELLVSSTQNDGNFVVYLEDVAPDGSVWYVTEALFRAIHRRIASEPAPYKTWEVNHSYKVADAEPLVPGQPASLAFDFFPISFLFKKGHAIRIAIAGADADQFAPLNPEPPTVTIHRAGTRIVLPVVK